MLLLIRNNNKCITIILNVEVVLIEPYKEGLFKHMLNYDNVCCITGQYTTKFLGPGNVNIG